MPKPIEYNNRRNIRKEVHSPSGKVYIWEHTLDHSHCSSLCIKDVDGNSIFLNRSDLEYVRLALAEWEKNLPSVTD